MSRLYIGIDNGVSGSIGMVGENFFSPQIYPTPTIEQQDYTKKKKRLRRLNILEFKDILNEGIKQAINNSTVSISYVALIERPMVNPRRFIATVSAVRCLEAQLCGLESLCIPYIFVDSKQWQKELLPKGCQKEELKKASHDIGIRLFPSIKTEIEKQKDADGILIAEWARRNNL